MQKEREEKKMIDYNLGKKTINGILYTMIPLGLNSNELMCLPEDLPLAFQQELKAVPDPMSRLYKIFQFAYPESDLTFEELCKKLSYKQTTTYLIYFDLDR